MVMDPTGYEYWGPHWRILPVIRALGHEYGRSRALAVYNLRKWKPPSTGMTAPVENGK